MKLDGKRVAILVENIYEDLELWYPKLRLAEEGAETTVIGPRAETYTSKHGYPVKADSAIDDVKAGDFDAVVVPGGYAPDHMRRHSAMVKFVKDVAEGGKVVAAICHGGWMLASADVVRGKRMTCFFAIKDDMVNAGAEYEDKEVVRDGKLVTSRMPSDLPAFCKAIIGAVSGD